MWNSKNPVNNWGDEMCIIDSGIKSLTDVPIKQNLKV